MTDTAKMMTITIKESESGMLFATSEDEPTFFVSAVNASALWEVIPLAVEDIYRSRHHLEVKAFPIDGSDIAHRPIALIPHELLAQYAASRGESC